MPKVKAAQKVYLVVGAMNAPGRIFAVFAEYDAAVDYRDRYLEDEASVEERGLYRGQMLSPDRSHVLP